MVAKRAVELNSDSRVRLHTHSDVLVLQEKWLEALDRLERALQSDEGQPNMISGKEIVVSLIRAVAAGHGARVKQTMQNTGLVESMEPLWHAVRAELGEEPEPLPAEVMDAVVLLRARIAGRLSGCPGFLSDNHCGWRSSRAIRVGSTLPGFRSSFTAGPVGAVQRSTAAGLSNLGSDAPGPVPRLKYDHPVEWVQVHLTGGDHDLADGRLRHVRSSGGKPTCPSPTA